MCNIKIYYKNDTKKLFDQLSSLTIPWNDSLWYCLIIHCYASNNVLKHDNLMNALAFSFNGGRECHDLYFKITTYNRVQHYSTHQSYKVTYLIHYLLLLGTIWPFSLIHYIMSKLSPLVTTQKFKKTKG